jgi:hypothetical protein
MSIPEGLEAALNFGFMDAIFTRRSRRFGLGMEITEGTLAHKSRHAPVSLSELEEAFLIWAGTGMTGLFWATFRARDLMALPVTGRSWPCSCNSHSTELFYTNDSGVYMVRLQDVMPEEGKSLIFRGMTDDEKLSKVLELFRKSLVKLDDGRADLPKGEPGLFDFNAWNCNKPGTTFFVPVTNTTVEYMVLLHIF